ncbi:hypothetical protein [Pseudonocardia oceani]|uniref:hypothetical protein n=1 Tax=Pseudonocardia oceani TaxID=2792013 RepID=UPI001C4A231F|nr:hypothetical protein [Pseudonocardia oceani]
MELVVLSLGVLVVAAGVVWHAIDTLWARRLMVRRQVLVSLSSGRAFTGLLWARRGRQLVLKSAELLEPGAQAVVVDGDVVLDRAQVEYVQVVI